MFGWSWTEVSVLGSHVFGQILMENCGMCAVFMPRAQKISIFDKSISLKREKIKLVTTFLGIITVSNSSPSFKNLI